MKTISLLLIGLLLSSPLYAGTLTVTFDDADEARILEGITKNGEACNEGEGLRACAKRLLLETCKAEVRSYEKQRDAQIAREAVSDVNFS